MIKYMLKIINLNNRSLQIRSKHRTASASTKQSRTSFELSEFQSGTIKQPSNMRMHEPQIHIVNHDHSAVITWLSTHTIMNISKRSNFGKSTFNFKIQLFVLTKNLAKQFVLIALIILKVNGS
jgi:hypothetical protein